MKYTLLILALCLFLAPASSLNAYDGLDLYSCRISAKDRVNSQGAKLTTLPAILAQDRANYHKFGKRDSVDGGDATFSTPASRQWFESAEIRISDSLKRRILAGEDIDISVFVLEKNLIDIQEGLIDPNVG